MLPSKVREGLKNNLQEIDRLRVYDLVPDVTVIVALLHLLAAHRDEQSREIQDDRRGRPIVNEVGQRAIYLSKRGGGRRF